MSLRTEKNNSQKQWRYVMLISLSSFESISKKIAKMNKKLESRNLPVITYTAENKTYALGDLFSTATILSYGLRASWGVEVVDFKITSDVSSWIIESGYEIVAVIDHKENIVHTFIEDSNVEFFRNRHYCDHCKTKRNRSKSVILRSNDGNLIQVGTTCLSDFIKSDVDELVRGINLCAEDFAASIENEEEFFRGFSKERAFFNIHEVIPMIYRVILEKGFYPSSQGNMSTKSFVNKALYDEELISPTDEDRAIAPKIIEWISSLEDENSFTRNLIQIVKNGFVSIKTTGYLCAGVNSYISKSGRSSSEESDKNLSGGYFGNIGDKVSLNVTFKEVAFYFSYAYGGRIGYFKFIDEDGHVFIWKTSTSGINSAPGSKLLIKGTIKDHSEYRGIKQTILTRVKIVD